MEGDLSMLLILYLFYRIVCIYIIYKCYGKKFNRDCVKTICITALPPVLFWGSFFMGLAKLLLLLFWISGFIYIFTIIKCKNKAIKILSAVNIIEWATVYVPTFMNYFNRPVFTLGDCHIYFLFWKIYG